MMTGVEFIDENGGGPPVFGFENREKKSPAKNEQTYCDIAGNIYILTVRLVLDTAVMVAAIRSEAGASRRLLVAALEQRFTLPISVALMVEYEAVMTRKQ